ncbi:hypothetical protein PIB30_039522 [Stylosanthes scabra]|uniref:Uncharacterized protein n=1 Tax=Stylosanthes scabra TaxID=79078 RepID=A0ABU6REF2_9FABA|nr:hypothetical protein [Stylosanthes scabra]
MSGKSELVQVFLYNLGGGFREIRKVGYRFLSRQPNGRFVHLLVKPAVHVARLLPLHQFALSNPKMEMDNLESDSDYTASSRSSSDC